MFQNTRYKVNEEQSKSRTRKGKRESTSIKNSQQSLIIEPFRFHIHPIYILTMHIYLKKKKKHTH